MALRLRRQQRTVAASNTSLRTPSSCPCPFPSPTPLPPSCPPFRPRTSHPRRPPLRRVVRILPRAATPPPSTPGPSKSSLNRCV
ncbi:unnamed protein product [Callosobruchus maculatus]|uniref:Uncharacterized protein n=1 Tax=Callosobruchus maculatus TaxID=64391 RepID=A0A653BNI2_CALMS|nr:unnamed protein product [Callosobruchus maculatus]